MSFVYWVRLPEHDDILTQGYVGVTSRTPAKRWATHCGLAAKRKNPCKLLQNAILRYGAEGLELVSLVRSSMDKCLELENALRPHPFIGWNVGTGGQASALGMKRSEETKRKINAHKAGVPRSPETRAKLSIALMGNKCAKGAKRSREYVERIRAANTGRKHSVESRAKISAALKGRVTPESTRQKLREYQARKRLERSHV